MRKNSVALVAAAIVFGIFTVTAQAAVLVLGSGPARNCYEAAHVVIAHKAPISDGIAVCSQAIETQPLSAHDLAGTYNNRGVLSFALGDYSAALQDFDAAIARLPRLAEPHVSRAAALIAMRRFAEAVPEIDTGLALNVEEPERAYFDRALAYEGLHDQQRAYMDYLRSAELKPGWDLPRAEMARFTVIRRPKT